MCRLNNGNTKNDAGTSKTNTGPTASKTNRILRNVLTSSTCSVVNGPPNLSFKPGRKVIITILGEGTAMKWVLVFPNKVYYLIHSFVRVTLFRTCIEPVILLVTQTS